MKRDEELRNRIIEMAQSLLAATIAGKITWRTTPVENKYIYAGTRSSVTIQFIDDEREGEINILSLLNSQGTVVDSLETESWYVDDSFHQAEWNSVLEDLYHAARRAAHNVDEALESIMSDIERGTPSPPLKTKKKIDSDPWASDSGYSDEPPF